MNDLLINNISVLLAVCSAVLLLTLIQLFLAINQDKRETNAGPIKELEELKVEIERKEAQKLEIEGELEKFRKTLAEQAELMAQADYLQKRIEELQTEWNSLENKRSELKEFLTQTEKVQVERVEIETALKAAQTELAEIKEKLIEKVELDRLIQQLQTSKQEYEVELKKLRDEVSDIKQLKADEERLKDELGKLESKTAELSGVKQAMVNELSDLQGKLEALKGQTEEINKRQEALKEERAEFLAEFETEKATFNGLKNENERLSAQSAVLKQLIDDQNGERSGRKPVQDRLAKLKASPPSITLFEDLPEANFLDEKAALENVRLQFRSEGLVYDERVLNAFHTTMKTNETTQMAVLAGISGTGKSQLPRQYATGMGIGFLQIPVQPRWDSPQDLMGFYNYIESEFKPTDMARALYAMDIHNNPGEALDDRMMMILLDEMNLARVEYYFSDFLSRLESRPRRDLVADANQRKDAEIELEIPDANEETVRLFPGFNLLFAGTMNEDESTQSLSDKVVDRANVLKFGAPKNFANSRPEGDAPEPQALSKTQWDKWVRQPETLGSDEQFVNTKIDEMAAIMKSFGRPFGHRLRLAMKSYVANYPESDRYNGRKRIETALADQIELRLLPKLRGLDPEESVISQAFGDLSNMIKQDLGDQELADAVQTSIDNAGQNSQFNWGGVTR
jgi:predicted  nucleic acid-binding Zn-ribbon protein